MKKILVMCVLGFAMCVGLAACCNCPTEPVLEQNQKLIVPPDFGKKPA